MTPRRKETSRYEPTRFQNIERDRRSGIFYFRGSVKGQFIDKSLKTDKITEAKDRADDIRGLLDAAKTRARHTFDDAFDLVMKIQSTKASGTFRQTENQIEGHLRPWFKDNFRYLDQFERRYEESWAEYKIAQSKKTPGRKLEHDRRYLLMSLKRSFKRGWIQKDFVKQDFELNEVTEPIGQYLTDDQVRALLAGCSDMPKLELQILMAVTMGMRISEILHLQKNEINLKDREIDLDAKRLKTRLRRGIPIPISDSVYAKLSAAYADAPGEFVFPARHTNEVGQPVDPHAPQDNNRKQWYRARGRAGVSARFHDLRHTAITNMLKGGMPETAVRKICGVAEDVIRRVYAHIEQDLKTQFRGFFAGKFNDR